MKFNNVANFLLNNSIQLPNRCLKFNMSKINSVSTFNLSPPTFFSSQETEPNNALKKNQDSFLTLPSLTPARDSHASSSHISNTCSFYPLPSHLTIIPLPQVGIPAYTEFMEHYHSILPSLLKETDSSPIHSLPEPIVIFP